MKIKLVEGDSAGTVTAYYVSLLTLREQLKQKVMIEFVMLWTQMFVCLCSYHLPNQPTTSLILSFWAMHLASPTFCRRMSLPMALVAGSKGSICGSTLVKISTVMAFFGTQTRSCMLTIILANYGCSLSCCSLNYLHIFRFNLLDSIIFCKKTRFLP